MRAKLPSGLRVCFILCAFILSAGGHAVAADDVKIKILAVNPSETQGLKAVVTQALPVEVDPAQDILDKAGLEIKYDKEKKSYFLSKEVELKPKETLTFEVRVRDVWRIDADTVEAIKSNLEEQINGLKGTKYDETGKLLYERAQESIDRIVETQNQPMGINQHIELYRANVQQLEDIKNNAFSLEAMRRLEDEKKKGVFEARFLVEAENPSSEPRTITVRSFLPKDVTADDVIDRQGFNVLYDQVRKVYFLEKQESFAAKENKKYTIVIKDIWRIPAQELAFNEDQTRKLLGIFKETPFEKYANEQGKVILDLLTGISQLQADLDTSLALEDRMRAFVLNTQQMNVAKAKINNLQQLISEVSLKKDESQILEKLKLLIKKLAEIKDVVLVAMGIKPDNPMVWWIIFGIIIFLGVMSAVFYWAWLKKLQENRWAPKGKDKVSQTEPPAPTPSAAVPENKKE